MKHKKITIGAIQTALSGDRDHNLENAKKMVIAAAKKGAKIICLEELFRSRYFPQDKNAEFEQYAETIPGESTREFSKIAKEFGVVIVVPLFEKAKNGRYYNSAAVINEKGKLMDTYRKIHIPYDPLFYEKKYFHEGDAGYKLYKTKFAAFAVLICYDQWFPEAARMAGLAGAEIIFYPTAIGTIIGDKNNYGSWHDAWETVQRGHAIANSINIVAVNRAGREGKINFWGQSFICDAFGKILKKAGAKKDEILIAELNLGMNYHIRKEWGFFANRRPDTYGRLLKK
ncbi:MAG: carbon-nitrogen hydrolase [Patescibacteria group bacterium]|jgi:agmatine deiminase